MKKLVLSLLLLCSTAFAQTNYNSIATAYVTTTISQNVVFNSTMQQGGTFTFSALAHNGGGRPNENDTANVRIQFYTAGGALVSQVNSNYSANLAITSWSQGNPAAQTDVPWSVLTVSSTNCGGSCANVAYATVSMYGIDASYWAGDYGPWYRAPTLQRNGGGNLLYNPEFGPAYGYNAQGWTTNPGMGACQGAWGGSNPCIVNSSGTPGQSTVGLVANENGGGPSATGGTTSGTAGGYNSTMSVTNAGPGTGTPQTPPPPPAPPPPAPTAIYNNSSNVYVTRAIPTSNNSPSNEGPANAFDNNPNTKYLNFDKQNAGVTVQLNAGRVVTSFKLTTANDAVERDPTSYKLYGSNDGSTWTLIQQGTLSLSDNRFSVSNDIPVTNSTAYVYYFMIFPSIKNNSGNSVQIAEITYFYDANNTTTSTATSNTVVDPTTAAANTLCCGGSASSFNANATNIAKVDAFINRTTADSQVYIEQIGNQNTITVNQTGTRNNYTKYYGNGSSNDITITQSGNGSTVANYIDLSVTGNSNTVNLTQTSTGGGKGIFATVNNSNNSLIVEQKDSGSHYAEISLTGGNKSVNLTQQGSAGHMANISLSGNSTSLNLTQSGSTQQFYSIQHNCSTAGGCTAISVQQGQ
jgi:hypothetical protein